MLRTCCGGCISIGRPGTDGFEREEGVPEPSTDRHGAWPPGAEMMGARSLESLASIRAALWKEEGRRRLGFPPI
jgi:hypothetical protein